MLMDIKEKTEMLYKEYVNAAYKDYEIGKDILDEPIKIRVKQDLSIKDKGLIVNLVLNDVFLDDGTYLPYVVDSVLKVYYLEICTDFKLLTFEDNTVDLEPNIHIFDLLWNVMCDSYKEDEICDCPELDLFFDLKHYVKEVIHYKLNIGKFDFIFNKIKNVFSKINKILSDVNLEELNNYAESISKISGDFKEDNIIDALIKYHSNIKDKG